MPRKKIASEEPGQALPPASPDPAARDVSGDGARDGARKRRDPEQPAAVVGLGASAGGIGPLQQFFADMNPKSELAFVVVMHLSPDFESQLAEIIQQKTKMPVVQVTGPVKVRPNQVYVIPPNHQLTFNDSMLELEPPQQTAGRRVTIDLFFRTLAQAYGQRAVCVILSGTDSDGAIGLKHIRAQGGVTIAQDPAEAEFDSMPATAISTGMVDWVLPVGLMPEKLLEFVRNEHRMRLPPELPEGEDEAKEPEAPGGETVSEVRREPRDEDALLAVLADVRVQTGHDFSHYKRATVLRRVARRLQVNSIETIPQYLDYLRTHAGEGRALLQDLLIGVTHFFRDREAFTALESHIPHFFAGKTADDEVRVWVAGCATGEEAYSVAMLLCEQCKRLPNPPSVQVFATDIDEESLADARQGLYPATIEADVSPERLREFFLKDQGRYRVTKNLREKVLFAKHNLLTDAPFSRCDLVSCRNLLIYLKQNAQRSVFDIFHFALRAGGLLFLGGAENDAAGHALFSSVDSKQRIFVRRSTPRPGWQVPLVPTRTADIRMPRPIGASMRRLPALTQNAADDVSAQGIESVQGGYTRREALFGELHLRLLEQYGPPSVVVNEAHDIVHLSESAGHYLQFVAGEPTANISRVVRPALQVELRTALFKASQSKTPVQGAPAPLEVGGKTEMITVEVRPMRASDDAAGFYLVLFLSEALAAQKPSSDSEQVTREADDEMQFLKRQLAQTVEQYEAANEELKASNEELQAMNEELRSAGEELETSKEELQSVNEELITVNHELKSNIEELSRVNADLNNLMSANEFGTLFLDRALRIERFTPAAQKIFNLIPADIGRPITDITHRLRYEGFVADMHQVLDDLRSVEHEVRVEAEGEPHWYLARIAPYRTSEDRIGGLVATFFNITERKSMDQALRASEQRLQRIINVSGIGVLTFDYGGAMRTTNDAFLEMVGYTREEFEAQTLTWRDFTPPEYFEASSNIMKQLRETGRGGPYEKEYLRKDGGRIWLMFVGADLGDGTIAEYVVDISARKRAEEKLRESEERFRQFAENSADVFWILDARTEQLEYVNPVYEKMFGQSREVLLADRRSRLGLVPSEDQAEASKGLDNARAGKNFVRNYRIVRPTDGQTRWIRDIVFPIRDYAGKVVRIAGVAQDITEDKEGSEALRESEERFRLLVEGARDYAIFMVDPSNTIVHWNEGAERIFGWSAEEAVGQSGELIFTPEDRAVEQEEKEIEVSLRDGSASDCRWHMRKDGSRIWVEGVMTRLDDEETGALRGFAKIARDATEQHQAREELERRVAERTLDLTAINEQLHSEMKQRLLLEQEILLISEREKRRIGQDLHDSLCQELAGTAFLLQSSAQRFEKRTPAAAKALTDAAKVVNDNVGLARDLARGLHPVELSTSGLSNALRELAFRTRDGVDSRFECPKPVRITDDAVALNYYRIAQEAVTNALKHAKPNEIIIRLERKRGGLVLTIEDDGRGLSREGKAKGMGLHIMRYRANVIGATCTVGPRKPRGTCVRCVLPRK